MTDALMVREAAEPGRRWSFGSAVLDERSLELQVGGQQVELERKPLEVLLYLLHHAGEVVTKDDLAENLWPGRILTETVLTRCISLLRQALHDDDRTLIRTVHGYGYRLVARVKVETSAAPAPPTLEFKAGDSPATRPQWRLVERLGTGGHGEAWLARHEKTGDARVFKFALDVGAVASLKREITLYRLMHDSLGARAAVAKILEWNLEEPPYFLEMEYVAGGNLQAWSEAQGGLAGMSLSTRLELVAKIADALAGAHSVGALHKDLKPGNVLIQVGSGEPAIRLCDFGSGTVLDPRRLEALGITRLGFTKTLAQDTTSATPLYIAPEVIAGQPFTVQADIYALGILLYQVVTGELRRALAPGWEADVEDELLREDIAAAAAGNPARRLTDASQLAERLRSLEQRRETRAAEVAARQRAERVRRIQQELRRTRVFAALLIVLTVVAVAGGVVAYRARDEAVSATATAKAISDFLMQDVLRTDLGIFKPSETPYESLLRRAADEVGVRLRDQPAAAASIHLLLGQRFQQIGQFEAALQQYERAVALCMELYGEGGEPTLMALDRLAWMYAESGRPKDALETSTRISKLWQGQLRSSDLSLHIVRTRMARTALAAGQYDVAEQELRAVINGAAATVDQTALAMTLLKEWLGVTPSKDVASEVLAAYAKLLLATNILEEVAAHEEPRELLTESLGTFSSRLGDGAELTGMARLGLAVVLANAGQYEEAEAHAFLMRDDFDSTLPAGHYARGLSRIALGRLRIEQQRHADAISVLTEAVDLCGSESACPTRLRAEFLWNLGRAYLEGGDGESAIEILRAALAIEPAWRSNHVIWLAVRVDLADALRIAGRAREASALLAELDANQVATLRPLQQTKASLYRVQGLIQVQQGQYAAGIASLEQALAILVSRSGATHWRSSRTRTELEAARETLRRATGE